MIEWLGREGDSVINCVVDFVLSEPLALPMKRTRGEEDEEDAEPERTPRLGTDLRNGVYHAKKPVPRCKRSDADFVVLSDPLADLVGTFKDESMEGTFSVNFSCHKTCGDGPLEQWEDVFTTSWRGVLQYEKYDGGQEKAGWIDCLKVHRSNIPGSLGNFGVSDDEHYEVLLDPLGNEEQELGMLLDKIQDEHFLEEINGGDCLFVQRIHVKEKYKGLGLGLFMIDMADKVINSPMKFAAGPVTLPHRFVRRPRSIRN
tara:strand:+ start:1717 stop:2490 length:774 start_codon:yes stop_codon:yes gene_type:complete